MVWQATPPLSLFVQAFHNLAILVVNMILPTNQFLIKHKVEEHR